MTLTEIADILRQFNEWQQGRNTVLRPSLSELSEAIGGAVEMIERLEAVETDALAKLEAAEKERDALRARIEAMERQGPGFRERCTPSAPTGCSNRFPLYALPGAQGESE